MTGVDYASGAVPDDYRCGTCGAHGCKLWWYSREAPLLCVACAEQRTGERLGWSRNELGWRSWIGWSYPAVPCEDGDGLYAPESIPAPGLTWWRALPMALPQPKVTP
jgi:hypothetical protein